ncbi:MAG: LysE family transporter [Desulfobacterales bacterium]|jgi:threonine/homoserine/homoserine lactone efflux protein|nr:LysE family transporter [Desulfobacterales bacterium]
MEFALFWKGVAVGFLLCAPLGPVGILCIRHALVDGRLAGALAVLGAAVVDAAYCLVAALGITLVSGFLEEGRSWIQPLGGLALALVGFHLTREHSGARGTSGRRQNLMGSLFSTFFLMLSNPLPILIISAAISAFSGPAWVSMPAAAALLMAGVFLGSLLWAPILVIGAAMLKPLLQHEHLRRLQRASGIALLLCGIFLGITPFVRQPGSF